MNAPFTDYVLLEGAQAEERLKAIALELRAGSTIPYLGPGLAELAARDCADDAGVARRLFRDKGRLAEARQGQCLGERPAYREHEASLNGLHAHDGSVHAEGGADAPASYFAELGLPMIVDTWYDSAMRDALSSRSDWGEVQGITRAGIGEDRWFRFYDAKGAEAPKTQADSWRTVLYKPHGSIAPAKNYLISDADYVEVLTEIDIQTPIPDVVKNRRAERSFLFVGCRFHDQMLRTYARQITKRSTTTHHALVTPELLTKNELKFLTIQGIIPLAIPLPRASEILIAA